VEGKGKSKRKKVEITKFSDLETDASCDWRKGGGTHLEGRLVFRQGKSFKARGGGDRRKERREY